MVSTFNSAITESLFREESVGSEWDETVRRLSKQAVAGDRKFQKRSEERIRELLYPGQTDEAFELAPGGRIVWRGTEIARLVRGRHFPFSQ